MAQRNSASANDLGEPLDAAPRVAESGREARSRAAAYLDLWERQLALFAARGMDAPRAALIDVNAARRRRADAAAEWLVGAR